MKLQKTPVPKNPNKNQGTENKGNHFVRIKIDYKNFVNWIINRDINQGWTHMGFPTIKTPLAKQYFISGSIWLLPCISYQTATDSEIRRGDPQPEKVPLEQYRKR